MTTSVLEYVMNLQELPAPRKLDSLGLSHSRLNERYHSMEKVNSSHNDVSVLLNAVSNKEYMTKAEALLEEQLESVSQRGESSHRKYSRYVVPKWMTVIMGKQENSSLFSFGWNWTVKTNTLCKDLVYFSVNLVDYIGIPIIPCEIKSWLKFEKRILFTFFNVVLLEIVTLKHHSSLLLHRLYILFIFYQQRYNRIWSVVYLLLRWELFVFTHISVLLEISKH